MGSCLSKKGTKGRDGDDPDKMPYTKAAGDSGKKGKKKGKQQEEVDPPVATEATPTASPPRADGDQDRSSGEPRDKDTGPQLDVTPADATEQSQDEKADDKQQAKVDMGEESSRLPDGSDKAEPRLSGDLSGTQTTIVRHSVQNDDRQGRTVVVSETDIKVDVTSDDNKTTQVKHEKKTIQRTEYDTQGTQPVASSSVVKDVRPVVMPDAMSSAQKPVEEPPMALFGALKYLKEQEQAQEDDIGRKKPEGTNRPVSDIFANMYKTKDPSAIETTTTICTPPAPTASQVTSSSSRPISDVFANMYKPTQTNTVTSEVHYKGDMVVQRVQHVSVTHDNKEPVILPVNVTPPPAPSINVSGHSDTKVTSPVETKVISPVETKVTSHTETKVSSKTETVTITNGMTPEKPVINGVNDVPKIEKNSLLVNDDDTDDGGSAPPSPLTPLRITEPGDEQSPLGTHVNANVIITTPEPPAPVTTISTNVTPPKEQLSPVQPTQEEEAVSEGDEDEENGIPVETEPIVRRNLRSMVKELLITFKPENDTTLGRHELCANTRQRIIAAMEKWLSQDCKVDGGYGHVVMVTGPPGIGKTCLMAEMCKRQLEHLAGYHFFEYNSPNINHNRLHSVITSLAHDFCDVFPNYVNMLPKLEKVRQAVVHGSIPELFDMLVHTPLSSPELVHDPEKQMLIVLEAIDDCDLQDQEILAEIISDLSEKCPSWLHVLLTARTDAKLFQGNEAVHTMEMKYNSNDNNIDIKRFFKDPLGRFMDRISLDGGLTQLAKKTEGSFLCATLLKKRLEAFPPDKKIALREIVPMFPSSLSGVCKEIFSNFLESLSAVSRDERKTYSAILSNIAVAREPLPLDFIPHVTNTKSNNPLSLLADIEDVLLVENGCVSFCHREIADWLLDDQRSATCSIDLVQGREQIATLCLKWVDDIINEAPGEIVHNPLMDYALKHAVYHLLEVSKQQENLSTLLCSLLYLQAKLGVPNMQVSHIREDYKHQHIQVNKAGGVKSISLVEYMKRHPKMLEQMNSYRKFLEEKHYDIQMCPEHVLQVAANYSTVERIKQNARRELDNKEWIEDVTAIPETHCIALKLSGVIKAMDVSNDGKTIAAVSKDEDYNLKLHLINALTGEEKAKPIDIKTLNSRLGLVARFFPDANNVFVGSLTTLISKTGKPTPSGFDVSGINVKDKFSIECADVSMKHFACGLTTFPWGGKSLHLSIFDMRTKKCLKTFEVLRFSYGGSAQFSIRACAVAKDKSLVCACVKMSAKPQLRITVWNVSKFQVMNSIDVTNEEITKCLFVGEQLLLLGGGIRSSHAGKASTLHVPVVSEFWNYKEITNKVSNRWDQTESWSLFSRHEDTTACCRWYTNMESALIHTWNTGDVEEKPSSIFRIRGVRDPSEMFSGVNCFVFTAHDEIYIYNTDDLEMLPQESDSSGHVTLPELIVHSVAFVPRSESIIITSQDAKHDPNENTSFTVHMSALVHDEMSLIATPFKNIPRTNLKTIDQKGQFKTFFGAGASTAMCFPSHDGNALIFNADNHIKVWDRINDRVTILQSYEDLQTRHPEFEEFTAAKAFASPKDNLLAVVYGQIPFNIYIYDVRSGNQLRVLSQEASSSSAVTDVIFLPSNGMLMAYYRSMNHKLVTWNPKTGEQVVSSSEIISYARASPASDRLAISSRSPKRNDGRVILKNSGNTMSKRMAVSGQWLPSNAESDLEFSPDGTILVGVCSATSVCRVWNAAKGEPLQDHPMVYNSEADVVGMLTNTHVVLQDDRLTIFEVASGMVVAVLPLDDNMDRKCKTNGMLLSPKGGMVVGIRSSGNLKVFRCHNFDMIKRKTTLQRMISFKKE